ncbi:hypothetical protein PP178_07890 [Zeaxanthinibacter sp. PT1]|uniref:hypothetical protein n=1 Tax=Zeaxanthinibacter TaxID=561554 RepID=UPI00234989BC|nr:hypothetical protein [Zeaxanthinibacter sp. PT1]MDC6351472.1 hypothetical protein [Zeaxanthinibacter sp. PT1]
MNRYAYLRTGLVCCAFMAINGLCAQAEAPIPLDSIQEMRVNKHTLMARFEPEFAISAKERLRLKEDRRRELEARLMAIDTLDLSFRKKWRLLEELYLSPHTSQWDKVVADMILRLGEDEPDP